MRRGGFDFRNGNHTPEYTSKTAPAEQTDESDQQIKLFQILRLNEPRQPLRTRLVKRRGTDRFDTVYEPDYGTPAYDEYAAHPLYILTRIRHFPNGGHRHGAVAARLKREGVRAGALDIYLDAARHGYHGLRIEMKANSGEMSDTQREERKWLEREGYAVHACWHYAEALSLILWYCSIPKSMISNYPTRSMVQLPKHGGHDTQCGCSIKLVAA